MTRIHIVSLPHTQLTRAYDWCAYTAKTRRLVDMLADAGHQALVYGPQEHECQRADEYIPIVTGSDRQAWFGAPEWDTDQVFNHWDPNHICWQTMNVRAATAIRERWQPQDVVGLIGGLCQKVILDLLADLKPLGVEWGIGYSGIIDGTHKVYESYAWAHHVAGFYRTDDVKFYDDVIANCFDIEDFIYGADPGKYLLYLGRPNARKGLPIIAEMAARTDLKVIIAGQPGPPIPNTDYVGVVTGTVKAELLAGARAVLCPTTYLEPFGGVAVEAMLSGTPVISSDWGAFTETVVPGITGYRCRMLADFLAAIRDCETIDRRAVRAHAEARYTTAVGSVLYGQYFDRLGTLFGAGWYTGA